MAPVNPDVTRFLHDGRLVTMPRRWEHRKAVARWLAHATLPDLLEPVGERELTDRLAALADDPVGVRRAMVDLGLVRRTRDGAEYWRTELTEYDDVVTDTGDGRTFHLDGRRVDSIAAFHDEVHRVLAAGEEGRLARSLDATLDALLRGARGSVGDGGSVGGGAGVPGGAHGVTVVWHDYAHSRDGLGFAATREYYRARSAEARGPTGRCSAPASRTSRRAAARPTWSWCSRPSPATWTSPSSCGEAGRSAAGGGGANGLLSVVYAVVRPYGARVIVLARQHWENGRARRDPPCCPPREKVHRRR